jgi:predicted MFS family arabinose efflux permease/SAM-dependent methyltransferase
VAGALLDANVFGTGWRMVFLINLTLGAYAALVGWKLLPSVQPTARGQLLDVRGALLAAAGVLLLVYPLVQGRELGWPTWSFGMLAAAGGVLAGFGWYQVRRSRAGQVALIELSVLARPAYVSGVLFVVVLFGAIVGCSLSLGLFLQLGLQYSPLRASVTMAPWAVGAFIGSAYSGTASAKPGRKILHLGLSLMVLGLTAVYMVFATAGAGLTNWNLALPLLVYGLGMGMIFVPLFGIILSGVADHEIGSASGLLEAVQQLGASLGVAILGTVFFSALGAQADFVGAAMRVALVAIALTIVTFGCGFLLPLTARKDAGGLALVALSTYHRRHGRPAPASVELLSSMPLLLTAAAFLHATRRGKFHVWAELLQVLRLRGDEHRLDMGCGRGAVLAKLVPDGHVVGLDLWRTEDQSGNNPEVTRRNLIAEGVAGRCGLETGDMLAMPFEDNTFDLVVSSLAIHNIDERHVRDHTRRLQAVSAAQHLRDLGMHNVEHRALGWRVWYAPFLGADLVTATKPEAT